MQVEKNDVDISKLFYYGDTIEITKRGKVVLKAYMRLVGDADLNRARVYAIRKGAELRDKLNTDGTDENIAYLSKKLEPKELINPILVISMQAFMQEALKNADTPVIPQEPDSDATLEEQEKYQKEIDDWPNKSNKMLSDYVEKKSQAEKERLEKLSDSELQTTYKRLVISDLCEQEMLRVFREQCIYFGTFTDKTCSKRLFKDYEQYSNLPQDVKEQFSSFYSRLDLSTEELKK